MRASEFKNKAAELKAILSLNIDRHVSMDVWCTMMEQHTLSGKQFLSESVDKGNLATLHSAEKAFSSTPQTGASYIPVPIFLIGDVVRVYDVHGHCPAISDAKFLPVTAVSKSSVTIGGIEWPDKRLSALSYMTLILIKDADSYDKLRNWLRLSMDITLPTLSITESVEATEIITEIERLRPGEFAGGKNYLIYAPREGKQYKPLPGGSGLKYAIDKRSDELTVYIIDDTTDHKNASVPFVPPKKQSWHSTRDYESNVERAQQEYDSNKVRTIVGKLDLLKKEKPFKNAYKVGTITVHEDYRGIGIAKALYGIVLSQLKLTLVSGSSQTPGGRKNWMSLAQIPGVEVKGLIYVDNDILTPDKLGKNDDDWYKRAVAKQHKEMDSVTDTLMSLGGQFVGGNTRSNVGGTYWAFDVMPGNGELSPAVKTKLSQIYSNDYGNDTLLYAVWTGK